MNLSAEYLFDRFGSVLKFIVVATIIAVCYGIEPIYNHPHDSFSDGNQNTKYLIGLAQAGRGWLENDWLANTIDPLPAFTWLVRVTYQFIHPEWGFYIYYVLIIGIYWWSIYGIVCYIFPRLKQPVGYWFYLAFFIFVHTVSIEIFKFDTAKHLQSGVAQQYILGPAFQPCNFGVFLLLSIYLMLKQRPYWAVAMLAVAVTFHPTYFPSVVVLTAAYCWMIGWQQKQWRKMFLVGTLSVLLTLPSFCYSYFTFTATTPELGNAARDIIVNFRIPHHSIPALWLAKSGGSAYVQTFLMAVSIYFVRKTRLFPLLFISFVFAVCLTILQMVINNNNLAFIAPWRISVFLMPIATGIILGKIIDWCYDKYWLSVKRNQKLLRRVAVAIITIILVVRVPQQAMAFNFSNRATPVLELAKQLAQPGQTYLVPTDAKRLYKFRLYTGVPIFINKKSHPYKDVEVIEWYNRVGLARKFYQADSNSCQVLDEILAEYSITHVILEQNHYGIQCENLQTIYQDEYYRLDTITR